MSLLKKIKDKDDSYLQLTDISLSTLLLFIICSLILCLFNFKITQQQLPVKQQSQVKKEHQALKSELQTLKKQKKADLNRLFKINSLSQQDLIQLNQYSEIQQLQRDILEELSSEIQKNSENNIDEKILSALKIIKTRAEQDYKSTLHYLEKENDYKNQSEYLPLWPIYFKLVDHEILVHFSPSPNRMYQLEELESILKSMTLGDGIKLLPHGFQNLNTLEKDEVYNTFIKAGWPLSTVILNLGS